ncbi:TetR/AcrR family transcriptional regulator [Kitasatospora sp. NPDC093558]|uniref:TetR/AcrR family transcriptional regulator n=1 Tax=Kitasatospora sp. NPDC093558 TaxID=3155201 RepID=UPI00343CC976
MPRVSRAEAQQHRQQVIDETSRLIREKGAGQVTVPEAMAAAGLTHGGFYRHFSSKDDLVAQALGTAFGERREAMDRLAGEGPSPRAEFVARYLSTVHRDNPGGGCPAATLGAEAARAEPGSAVRTAFTTGLRGLVDGLQQLDGDDRETALADLATLVGAILLARASDDAELSEEILTATRNHLTTPTA